MELTISLISFAALMLLASLQTSAGFSASSLQAVWTPQYEALSSRMNAGLSLLRATGNDDDEPVPFFLQGDGDADDNADGDESSLVAKTPYQPKVPVVNICLLYTSPSPRD